MRHLSRHHHPLAVVALCVFVGLLLEPPVLAAICIAAAAYVVLQLRAERAERRREIVAWLMGQGFKNDTLGEIASRLEGVTYEDVTVRHEAYLSGWREGFGTPRRGTRSL
ncbi:MAG: hypothetical protein ACYDBS_07315 [Acidimicrobiales bacterium]